MQTNTAVNKFLALGNLVITRNALNTLSPEDVTIALRRHECLDWGEVCPEDQKSNNDALKHGFRILSAYRDRNNTKFWIITILVRRHCGCQR